MANRPPAFYRPPRSTPKTFQNLGQALGLDYTNQETDLLARQQDWNSPFHDQGSYLDSEPMAEFLMSKKSELDQIKKQIEKGGPQWQELIKLNNRLESEINEARGRLEFDLLMRLTERIAVLLIPGLWWMGRKIYRLSPKQCVFWLGARVFGGDNDKAKDANLNGKLHVFAVMPHDDPTAVAVSPHAAKASVIEQCRVLGGITAITGQWKWLDPWLTSKDADSAKQRYFANLPQPLQGQQQVWYVLCGHGYVQKLARELALHLLNGDCQDWQDCDRMGRQHHKGVLNAIAVEANSTDKMDTMRVLADAAASNWQEKYGELRAAHSRHRSGQTQFDVQRWQKIINKIVNIELDQQSNGPSSASTTGVDAMDHAVLSSQRTVVALDAGVQNLIYSLVEKSIKDRVPRSMSKEAYDSLRKSSVAETEKEYRKFLGAWKAAQEELDLASEFIEVDEWTKLTRDERTKRIRNFHYGLSLGHQEFAKNCTKCHSLGNWVPHERQSSLHRDELNRSLNEFVCRALWGHDIPLSSSVKKVNNCRKGMVLPRVAYCGDEVLQIDRKVKDEELGVDHDSKPTSNDVTEYVVSDDVIEFEKSRCRKKKKETARRQGRRSVDEEPTKSSQRDRQADLLMDPGRATVCRKIRVGQLPLCRQQVGTTAKGKPKYCRHELQFDNSHKPNGTCSGQPTDPTNPSRIDGVSSSWWYFIDGERETRVMYRVHCSNPKCPRRTVKKGENQQSALGDLYFLMSAQIYWLKVAAEKLEAARKRKKAAENKRTDSAGFRFAVEASNDDTLQSDIGDVVRCPKCGGPATWKLGDNATVTVWVPRQHAGNSPLNGGFFGGCQGEKLSAFVRELIAIRWDGSPTSDHAKCRRLIEVFEDAYNHDDLRWTLSDCGDTPEQRQRVLNLTIRKIKNLAEEKMGVDAGLVGDALHEWFGTFLKLDRSDKVGKSGRRHTSRALEYPDASGP